MIGYKITAYNNGSMCDRGEIYLESMNLDKLFLELKYPEETEQMIRNERTCRKIKEISEAAYSGEEFKFELCNRQPLTRLAVVTFLLLSKYSDYKEKGIPDHILTPSGTSRCAPVCIIEEREESVSVKRM